MYEQPRINKPCGACGEIMEDVVRKRQFCSKCQKSKDNQRKKDRRKHG